MSLSLHHVVKHVKKNGISANFGGLRACCQNNTGMRTGEGINVTQGKSNKQRTDECHLSSKELLVKDEKEW